MVFLCDFFWYNPMNTIHIWYIYLPLVDFYGKFHDSEHLFFCRSQGYSTVCPVGRRCACRGSEGLEVCVVKGDTVHLISMGSCHFLGVFFFQFSPLFGEDVHQPVTHTIHVTGISTYIYHKNVSKCR